MPEQASLSGDWTPRPDPTLLTSQQLYHEIATLKELLESKIGCLENSYMEFKEVFKTLHADLNKEMEAKVSSLKELHHESISSLKELHNAAIHDTQKNAEVLTAVLQAAVVKSEFAYTKQFDAINLNNQTQNKANSDRIEDVKERMDRSEGALLGKTDTEKGHLDHTSLWIALAACVAAFLAAAIGGIGLFIAVYHKV